MNVIRLQRIVKNEIYLFYYLLHFTDKSETDS